MAVKKQAIFASLVFLIIPSIGFSCPQLTPRNTEEFGLDEEQMVKGTEAAATYCNPPEKIGTISNETKGKTISGQADATSTDVLVKESGIDAAEQERIRNLKIQRDLAIAERREMEEIEKKRREREMVGTPYSQSDQDRINRADQDLRKKRKFPWKVASSTEDPDLKKSLQFISATTEVTQRYKKEHAQLLATIAQLSQMALTTAQRAQNLGAVDPKTAPAISTKATNSQNAQASKIAETKPAISAKSNPEELTAEEVDQDSSLTAEQKTKLKTAIGEALKRKQLLALKQRLKNKLNAQGTKKDLKAEEATSAFNIDLIPDEPQRSLASVDSEKEKEDFLNSAVFHAMQAQFSMDGGQTRAEVERMLDEVEKELGTTGDILAGILGTDSKSLFERIKEAHQQCLRENCVLSIWKNRVP
jgi:hypothetical protein